MWVSKFVLHIYGKRLDFPSFDIENIGRNPVSVPMYPKTRETRAYKDVFVQISELCGLDALQKVQQVMPISATSIKLASLWLFTRTMKKRWRKYEEKIEERRRKDVEKM